MKDFNIKDFWFTCISSFHHFLVSLLSFMRQTPGRNGEEGSRSLSKVQSLIHSPVGATQSCRYTRMSLKHIHHTRKNSQLLFCSFLKWYSFGFPWTGFNICLSEGNLSQFEFPGWTPLFSVIFFPILFHFVSLFSYLPFPFTTYHPHCPFQFPSHSPFFVSTLPSFFTEHFTVTFFLSLIPIFSLFFISLPSFPFLTS